MRRELSSVGECLVDTLAFVSFEGGYSAGSNGDLTPQMIDKATKAKEALTAYILELESRVRPTGLSWVDISNLCT